MSEETQLLVVDKIKAWAFPILLSIISFFLYHFYTTQQDIISSINDNRIEQAVTNANYQNILLRLQNIEQAMKEERHKLPE